MIGLFTFLISLLLAVLALRGWPAEAGVWMRALLALAFLMIGTAAMLFSKSPSASPRLIGARARRGLDRAPGWLCAAMLIGLFYFILVFAPPASRELSIYVVTAVKQRLGWDGQTREDDSDNEPISDEDDGNYEFEVGGLFDPNGAVVPKSADLEPSQEPAVSLKMPTEAACEKLRDTGQLYMHLFSHHAFDGVRWTSRNWGAPTKISRGPDGLIHLEPDEPPAEHQYTVLRHEFSNGVDVLCSLQGVRHVRLPELTELNEGTWRLPPPDNVFGIIRPYQAGSSPRSFRQLMASGATIEPGLVGRDYLAPSSDKNLNALIRDLAVAFKRNPSLEEQLSDLQTRLSKSFVYSLKMDYPDKQKSALESFLDDPETGKGFCVHFASAAALILRELGVPSRVSYGWTGGEYYPEHKQFVFRSKDGHAWAEIYLKEHGWVVFETTPATGLPRVGTAPAGAIPPQSGAAIEGQSPPESESAKVPPNSDSWLAQLLAYWKWALILIGGAAVVSALLVLIRQSRYVRSANSGSAASADPPGYLQLFYKTCASLGHPKPPGCTLRQHLAKLDGEEVRIPFAEELLSYHYGVTYRGVPRDSRHEKQLCRQIKGL